MRPIFEQAGIASDFLPWGERFPRLAAAASTDSDEG